MDSRQKIEKAIESVVHPGAIMEALQSGLQALQERDELLKMAEGMADYISSNYFIPSCVEAFQTWQKERK